MGQFWAARKREGEINTRHRDDAFLIKGHTTGATQPPERGESPRRRVLTVEDESREGQGMAYEVEGGAELSVVLEQLKAATLITETETETAPLSVRQLERLHKHLMAGWPGEVTR